VTPSQLYRSDFIFPFYIYGSTFNYLPSIHYLHVEQFLVPYALTSLFGYVGTTGYFSAIVSDLIVWDGDYHVVVYCVVGSIPEELLLGQGRVFSI
jgi:hypothetical protein